jgi:hypothetical protein
MDISRLERYASAFAKQAITMSEYNRRFVSPKYDFDSVRAEWDELVEALEERNEEHIREEFYDLVLALQIWWARRTGMDWEMFGAGPVMEKYIPRENEWKRIFEEAGLEYDSKYFTVPEGQELMPGEVEGGNPAKIDKVWWALMRAMREQKPEEFARMVSEQEEAA